MVSIWVLCALSAAPSPVLPLPEIPAPLGRFGSVVAVPSDEGLGAGERIVVTQSCRASGVHLMRFLGGAGRVIEQLQQWLDRVPGLEKKLLGRKGALPEVMRHLGRSRFDSRVACPPLVLTDGFRIEADTAPATWCEREGPASQEGEHWLFSKKRPAAVVSVRPGETDACAPRISAVVFDERGQARLRIHADWGTSLSATLVGTKCQSVEFVFRPERGAYQPLLKSCKR